MDALFNYKQVDQYDVREYGVPPKTLKIIDINSPNEDGISKHINAVVERQTI